MDSAGNAYVTGVAYASDFPTTDTSQTSGRGGAFVVKLNAAGTALVYSTVLSFSGAGRSIAVDSAGNAYVTGAAVAGFPVVNAFQPAFGGGPTDAFVAKLNSTGSALIYSTYLGGSRTDIGNSIAVDSNGNAYVTGGTVSPDFPTTPAAFQRSLGSGSCLGFSACGDAFVTKLNPVGSVVYSSYLGGGHEDAGNGIAVDSAGNAYVTGETYSRFDFPSTPVAFQRALGIGTCPNTDSCADAFVTKLNPQGSALVYSTYLGGSIWDFGNSIALDPSGNVYVTGRTASADFPTTPGAFQVAKAGGADLTYDAFVTKLNPSGSALAYSTYLGGGGMFGDREDAGRAIAADSFGNAYVVGSTTASNFPTARAIQASPGGLTDGFVTKLNSEGNAPVYSTYLGGNSNDFLRGIAVDSTGNAYVIGQWWSGRSQLPPTSTPPLLLNKSMAAILVAKISESGTTPAFAPAGVTNGASFVSGLAFGEIATIFGTGLTNVRGIVTAGTLPLPTELAGTSVTAQGVALPLFAVANVNGQEQINFFAPFGSAPSWTIVVTNNGVRSVPVEVPLRAVQPGIFTVGGTNGAIQHGADFQLVTASNPAPRGEVIVIYATGLGDVQPRPELGRPASSSPLSRTVLPIEVTVGGIAAEVLFSGLAPGFVGLNQVNIRVPESAPSGHLDLVIKVTFPSGTGTSTSNVVKLPVQ